MGTQDDEARKQRSRQARQKMLMLMVGGAIGTYLRYMIGKWFDSQPWTHGFPLGTMVINVTGSFILATAATILLERFPDYQQWYLLVGSGFCGGYTTFSTFEWETYKLVRDASWWAAFGNVFGSVFAGFVGVILGVMVVNLLYRQP